MILDGNAECGEVPMGKMQRCKPDYEALIEAQRGELARHETFLAAVFEFNNRSTVRNKMAELVGELYSQTISIQKRIEGLIVDQEADETEV